MSFATIMFTVIPYCSFDIILSFPDCSGEKNLQKYKNLKDMGKSTDGCYMLNEGKGDSLSGKPKVQLTIVWWLTRTYIFAVLS